MALKPNEIEAHALLNGGEGGGDLFADGLAGTLATELGVSSVVVTLGESGCVAQAAGSSEDGGCRHDRRHRRVHATFAADLTAGEPVAGAIHAAESAATWAIGQEASEAGALPAEAFTARLATRTTEPVNKRLRLWALLRDYNLQVALTLALARGLPSDEELASELAGGKRTDAGATV